MELWHLCITVSEMVWENDSVLVFECVCSCGVLTSCTVRAASFVKDSFSRAILVGASVQLVEFFVHFTMIHYHASRLVRRSVAPRLPAQVERAVYSDKISAAAVVLTLTGMTGVSLALQQKRRRVLASCQHINDIWHTPSRDTTEPEGQRWPTRSFSQKPNPRRECLIHYPTQLVEKEQLSLGLRACILDHVHRMYDLQYHAGSKPIETVTLFKTSVLTVDDRWCMQLTDSDTLSVNAHESVPVVMKS